MCVARTTGANNPFMSVRDYCESSGGGGVGGFELKTVSQRGISAVGLLSAWFYVIQISTIDGLCWSYWRT